MKRFLSLLTLLLMVYSGSAQVPNTNESSFPVEGSIQEGNWGTYLLQGLMAERKLRLGVSNDGYTRAEIELQNKNTASGKIIFKTTSTSGGALERMTILNNGNVGIGVTAPTEMLEVNGAVKLGGSAEVKISPNLNVSTLNPGATTLAASVTGRKWGHFVVDIYGNDDKDAFAVRTDSNKDGTLDNIPFLVNNAGNVGIGTITPGNWKLAVNGNIRAKEIKVETGWSDFVFEEGYDLPTLEEVERHIKEKGHLRDIPSAKEVEENGIFLGEMDAKLLQKIEELMLYTIEQEKRIKKLESEIANLKPSEK